MIYLSNQAESMLFALFDGWHKYNKDVIFLLGFTQVEKKLKKLSCNN